MEAIYDLEMEISVTPEGPEREELERTLEVCRELMYLSAEGFIEIEEVDDGEDYRVYPIAESFDADLIEA